MANCYICGDKNATRPLALKDSFTAHTRCKCPDSKQLCDRCYDCIEGQYKQCWYYHPTKEKWSKLWGRNWSWLSCNHEDYSYPTFSPTPFDDGLLRVENLPTRENIREWLLNPPNPPFIICIAVSGQKHTYPFSVEAYDRNMFPVLMEENLIMVNRVEFKALLAVFEALMGMGFSKTEIVNNDYYQHKLLKINLKEFYQLDSQLTNYRASLLFKLIEYVSIKLD